MPFLNKIGKCDNLQCGLIHMVHNLPVPVPLKNVHLDVKIVDFISQVTITQEYVNEEVNPIEVLYSYPVEESAAIIAFEAVVDGHEIEAEVKKKEEAKADYNQAMVEGNTAILLEETAPDIFSMKLGQLKPGAGAKVKLTYIMELPVEDKSIRLTIPTTIAPRYIPPTDDSPAAKTIANLTYNINKNKGQIPMYINIESIMKGKIKKITSPTHSLKSEIKVSADENGQFQASSDLGNATTDVMDRDLVVLIQTEEQDKPVVFIEKTEESLAAMVSLIPSFKLDDQKVELIFLVDRSGSMDGESMEQAIKALGLFLHSIPADCYFNIWSFGSKFSCLFNGGSKGYDDKTLNKAKNHTNQMTANFGGTEVYRPLEAIFNEKSIPGYAKQIFLLTDGDVSNNQSVIELVKDNCKNARVFTLGLGSSASRNLVKGVARAGNGTSIFASLNEDLRPKVMTLLKDALMPSLTNVEISWNQEKEVQPNIKPKKERSLLGFNKPDPKVTKKNFSSPGVLFDGSRMLSFKIFKNEETPENVTITAQAPDGPLSVSIPINEECVLNAGKLVHQMAARKQIQDLEEENSEYVPEEIKEQISDLALKYGIASKYTSFVGVDKKTRKSVLEPAMCTRKIQQEVPHAFGFNATQGIYNYTGITRHRHSAMNPFAMSAMHPAPNMPTEILTMGCPPPPMASYLAGSRQPQRVGCPPPPPLGCPPPPPLGCPPPPPLGCPPPPMAGCPPPPMASCPPPPMAGCPLPPPPIGMNMRVGPALGSSRFERSSRFKRSSFDFSLRSSDASDEEELGWRESDENDPSSNEDTLTKLIHLQTANGSFKFGQALQSLIGMTENQLMEKLQEPEVDGIWITAVALVLLEKKFSNDKELWELIAKKAKLFIQKHAKSNRDEIMKKASNILTFDFAKNCPSKISCDQFCVIAIEV